MKYFLFKNVNHTESEVCGCALLNPGWKHMSRKLERETVLILGKKNSTLILDEDTELQIKPGRITILPAKHFHRGAQTIKESVSYYWLHFYQCINLEDEIRFFLPKEIEENEALTIFSSPKIAYQRFENSIILPQEIDLENPTIFENSFNEILQEFSNPSYSPLLYKSLVQKFLLDLCGQCFKNKNSGKDDSNQNIVQKLLILLESELSNPNASVKFFADKLKINSDYLGRSFKNAMKISVGKYISQRRIELACSRLRETNFSIEEIYLDCGFGSKRQFYDEFKKITGKTPAYYRSQCSFIKTNTL